MSLEHILISYEEYDRLKTIEKEFEKQKGTNSFVISYFIVQRFTYNARILLTCNFFFQRSLRKSMNPAPARVTVRQRVRAFKVELIQFPCKVVLVNLLRTILRKVPDFSIIFSNSLDSIRIASSNKLQNLL